MQHIEGRREGEPGLASIFGELVGHAAKSVQTRRIGGNGDVKRDAAVLGLKIFLLLPAGAALVPATHAISKGLRESVE
jgi:hypothetical protein